MRDKFDHVSEQKKSKVDFIESPSMNDFTGSNLDRQNSDLNSSVGDYKHEIQLLFD